MARTIIAPNFTRRLQRKEFVRGDPNSELSMSGNCFVWEDLF